MEVTMHFGDGSFKELDMPSDDPETAVNEAATWVHDNAWFEAYDEAGDVAAEVTLA